MALLSQSPRQAALGVEDTSHSAPVWSWCPARVGRGTPGPWGCRHRLRAHPVPSACRACAAVGGLCVGGCTGLHRSRRLGTALQVLPVHQPALHGGPQRDLGVGGHGLLSQSADLGVRGALLVSPGAWAGRSLCREAVLANLMRGRDGWAGSAPAPRTGPGLRVKSIKTPNVCQACVRFAVLFCVSTCTVEINVRVALYGEIVGWSLQAPTAVGLALPPGRS